VGRRHWWRPAGAGPHRNLACDVAGGTGGVRLEPDPAAIWRVMSAGSTGGVRLKREQYTSLGKSAKLAETGRCSLELALLLGALVLVVGMPCFGLVLKPLHELTQAPFVFALGEPSRSVAVFRHQYQLPAEGGLLALSEDVCEVDPPGEIDAQRIAFEIVLLSCCKRGRVLGPMSPVVAENLFRFKHESLETAEAFDRFNRQRQWRCIRDDK